MALPVAFKGDDDAVGVAFGVRKDCGMLMSAAIVCGSGRYMNNAIKSNIMERDAGW